MARPTLDPEELADLRAHLETTFTDTATVQRTTSPADDRGGVTPAFATVATVACRLIPDTSPIEGGEAAKMTAVTTWTVLLPWDTGVGAGDRLVINGETYEVLEDNGDRTEALQEAVTVRRAK